LEFTPATILPSHQDPHSYHNDQNNTNQYHNYYYIHKRYLHFRQAGASIDLQITTRVFNQFTYFIELSSLRSQRSQGALTPMADALFPIFILGKRGDVPPAHIEILLPLGGKRSFPPNPLIHLENRRISEMYNYNVFFVPPQPISQSLR
jgi:hypothetical protein